MAIKSVCFVSRAAIERHIAPRQDASIVSITDPDEPLACIADGFHGLLRLQFHDLEEESINVPVGLLPDLRPGGRRIDFGRAVLPDASDAIKIITFIRDLSAMAGLFHLIVHCEAGISRSAAVASFVADRFCVPIEQANPDTSAANARLLRLLNKAAEGREFDCRDITSAEIERLQDKKPKVFAKDLSGIF